MKTALLQALLISGLFFCTSVVAASEQAAVSARDRGWMKQQQQALQEFQQSLQERPVQLPAAQQDLIARLQGDIARQQETAGAGNQRTVPAIYFVSLGIPREGLLPMLQDANRFNIPATIRGLVNNDMRQTAAVMFELAKEDKNAGVQIDPTLFSDYHIKTVPALVVTCSGHVDIIRGSLPLRQALEKIAASGDCASTARQLMEATQ
ncbi:type-F conjugative transfer system pilin assembly protein TrbC [Pseudescherichia sp.]|uniref:type-F conjugative transfer system pilin assembly protein TrbC n=1 Tax=Pseudescherichia sp. TaxID=2055881 RepID=UPI0028ACA6B9|nr:type-F conjugative transfer system pilin assembly protein TrbC [Pseudescherichia sp.]